jgi:hypothetical protein
MKAQTVFTAEIGKLFFGQTHLHLPMGCLLERFFRMDQKGSVMTNAYLAWICLIRS